MPGAKGGAVPLALFKALLRFAQRAEGVPMALRHSDVAALAPGQDLAAADSLFAAAALRRLAGASFRQHRALGEPEASQALDRGFEAMSLLHTEYAECLASLREQREGHADRGGVRFSVGSVLTHAKFGYRGVVLGWDRSCQREPGWAAAMKVREDQPFYSVLPDEDDCLRLLGGTRLSKYVAEENMAGLGAGSPRARLRHRAIGNYFLGFSPGLGRYIPNAGLQYEYPDAYAAPDLEDCSGDSNLLAGPQQPQQQQRGAEAAAGAPGGAAAPAPGGEGKGPRTRREQLERIASEFLGP